MSQVQPEHGRVPRLGRDLANKIRVLHVICSLRREGIQNHLLRVLELYDHTRFQMDLCCRGPIVCDTAKRAEAAGARVLSCKSSRYFLPAAVRFYRFFFEHQYDVVVDHYPVHGWPALWAAWKHGIPCRIGVLHSTRIYPQNHIIARGAQWFGLRMARWYCTGICGVSKHVLDVLYTNWTNSNGFFRVLHLGIDRNRFAQPISREDVRNEMGIPLDVPVIGNVAGFREPKNHFFIINVFKRLLYSHKNACLLLVGDGALRRDVEKYVHQQGIQDRVVFTGWRRDVERMCAAMDVFFFPSLFEGFGLAASEASMCGVPVVCSNLPGILEGIHPEASASCAVEIDSIEQAVETLGSFITNKGLRERIAALNREWVQRNFAIDHSVKEYERMFADAIGKPQRRPAGGLET